jgi:hypothetical protein
VIDLPIEDFVKLAPSLPSSSELLKKEPDSIRELNFQALLSTSLNHSLKSKIYEYAKRELIPNLGGIESQALSFFQKINNNETSS